LYLYREKIPFQLIFPAMNSILNFTIVQSQLHWENRDANLQMFEKKIRSISGKTEVVLLPETFTTGFSMKPKDLAETMDGETVQWMKRLANEKKVIIAGSVIIEEDGQYYNRLIWMLPNGHYGIYNKRHRFAFAGEDKEFSPGNKRLIASVNGWKINLMVCYDLRFPVWARQADNQEYDVLVYVANWPERRSHAWKTLLQARAIENQCYVIGVNRVGDDGNQIHYAGESMAIDPLGEVLYTKTEAEDIFTVSLNKEQLDSVRQKLPFWRDADRFMILEDEE
jgi:omega-amidase